MLIFLFRRLTSIFFTLLSVITLTFFLMRLAPGGPFDGEQAWPPQVKENIIHRYELDLPIFTQFGHWLIGVAHGDLRESFQYFGHPVTEIIQQGLPKSALMGSIALIASLILGILSGCLAAQYPRSRMDHGILWVSSAFSSLPSYLFASLLIFIFSLKLRWFPPALWEDPTSLVLPTVTLAARPWGMITTLTRTSMLEALKSHYIRTAYGKGLSQKTVLFKHALKNSLIPIITVMGPVATHLISGTFLVETVFQIPGMGKHFVQAVLNRDYPLVIGATLIYGTVLVLLTLLTDVLLAWADPRIRLEGKV